MNYSRYKKAIKYHPKQCAKGGGGGGGGGFKPEKMSLSL